LTQQPTEVQITNRTREKKGVDGKGVAISKAVQQHVVLTKELRLGSKYSFAKSGATNLLASSMDFERKLHDELLSPMQHGRSPALNVFNAKLQPCLYGSGRAKKNLRE
jgi:hypothetical protein